MFCYLFSSATLTTMPVDFLCLCVQSLSFTAAFASLIRTTSPPINPDYWRFFLHCSVHEQLVVTCSLIGPSLGRVPCVVCCVAAGTLHGFIRTSPASFIRITFNIIRTSFYMPQLGAPYIWGDSAYTRQDKTTLMSVSLVETIPKAGRRGSHIF
jgi:hypothetical protein